MLGAAQRPQGGVMTRALALFSLQMLWCLDVVLAGHSHSPNLQQHGIRPNHNGPTYRTEDEAVRMAPPPRAGIFAAF